MVSFFLILLILYELTQLDLLQCSEWIETQKTEVETEITELFLVQLQQLTCFEMQIQHTHSIQVHEIQSICEISIFEALIQVSFSWSNLMWQHTDSDDIITQSTKKKTLKWIFMQDEQTWQLSWELHEWHIDLLSHDEFLTEIGIQ